MSKTLFSKDLTGYAEKYTTAEPPLLAALDRETNIKTSRGVMLSGHVQGTYLKMMSQAIQPNRILEIGTFTGYSAICLAQGLQQGGKLHTVDIDEELQDIAARYFEKAGINDKVVIHTGAAKDIIPAIDEVFDLVFIDADKVNYDLYFDLVIDKVRQGGFILADNVMYNGEVVLPVEEQSKNAQYMDAFNKKINNDGRVECLLMPLRDGMMVMRKK